MLEILAGLPCRGKLQQEVHVGSLRQSTPRRYLADHTTAPPEGQRLETQTTTELLVSLQQNKKREAVKAKQEAAKRPADSKAALIPCNKRQQISAVPSVSSFHNHATSQYSVQQLQGMTLKELTTAQSDFGQQALDMNGLVQEIVKAKGGTMKGRKDQLIARIIGLQKGKSKA